MKRANSFIAKSQAQNLCVESGLILLFANLSDTLRGIIASSVTTDKEAVLLSSAMRQIALRIFMKGMTLWMSQAGKIVMNQYCGVNTFCSPNDACQVLGLPIKKLRDKFTFSRAGLIKWMRQWRAGYSQ